VFSFANFKTALAYKETMSDIFSKTHNLSDELSSNDQTLSDQVLTFDSLNRNGNKIFSLFVTGVSSLITIVGMLIWLFSKPPAAVDGILPGVIGGLSVIPIFSFLGMFLLSRTARSITLDFDAVVIDYYGWSKRLKYEYITKIEHQLGSPNNPLSPTDLLLLLDWNHKVVGCIPIKVTNFNTLETELLRRLQNATGKNAYNKENELAEKRRRKRRQQFWMTISFGFFILLQCGGFIWGCWSYYAEQQIQKNSVSIEATIKKHYLVNNYGRRLEYTFTVNSEEYTRDVRLYDQEWTKLKGEKSITVIYLPNNPNINRPKQGERNPDDAKILMYVCPLGILLFASFFILVLLGYDLESHNNKLYLIKPGQILEDRLAELGED
jgi:hypothetical protein